MFAVIHNYLLYSLNLRLPDQRQVVTLFPPWQLVSSVPFLPLSLLQHYRGLDSNEEGPYIEANALFHEIPVTQAWIPRMGDLIAVKFQDGNVSYNVRFDVAWILLLRCGTNRVD